MIFSSKVDTRSSRDPLKFSLKLSTMEEDAAFIVVVEVVVEVVVVWLSTPEDEGEDEEDASGVISVDEEEEDDEAPREALLAGASLSFAFVDFLTLSIAAAVALAAGAFFAPPAAS